MATPQMLIQDPTFGLELIDARAEGTEATRYVYLALDVLDPERRDQVERLRRGGEEVSSHCLRRTQNYVPRCWITPVEVWVEHMPPHAVPEGIRSVEVKDPSLITPESDTRSAIQNLLRGKPLRSIRTYPGDEMSDITGTYQKVGITELEALRGVEWDSGEAQRLQNEFFPPSWPLPVALRAIEERIHEASSAHPAVAEDMLRSVNQSRRWAQARLQAEHVLLDTRKEHQWTYTYSPIARSLLAQLEMTPRDQGWETLMAQSNIHLAQAIANTQPQGTGMDINALATAIATAIVTAQNANKTAEQVKDESASAPKEYLCSGCGQPFDSPQGKSMHERKHCKVLNPDGHSETE
jgi:hypothetical protein